MKKTVQIGSLAIGMALLLVSRAHAGYLGCYQQAIDDADEHLFGGMGLGLISSSAAVGVAPIVPEAAPIFGGIASTGYGLSSAMLVEQTDLKRTLTLFHEAELGDGPSLRLLLDDVREEPGLADTTLAALVRAVTDVVEEGRPCSGEKPMGRSELHRQVIHRLAARGP